MTLGGWITFLCSIGFFISLFAWCIYKTLSIKKNTVKDLHEALEAYDHDHTEPPGGKSCR